MRTYQFILILVISMASLSSQAQSVSFETATTVQRGDGRETIEVKEKEKLNVQPGESLFVYSKKGFPLLIFAAQSAKTHINVTEADFEKMIQTQLQPEIERRTSEVVESIRKIESQIQKRDYNQAAADISPLKAKYKNISSVLFLSGTVNYLNNNKSIAIEDLQNGLLIDASNAAAKKLLEQLRGAK